MEDLENFDTTIQEDILDDSASNPYTKYFTKETFLRRSKSIEEKLRQSGDVARVDIAFYALKI